MDHLVIVLLVVSAIFGTISVTIGTGFNFHFDRIVVAGLRILEAPVCPEARMIAASIYQHPEQWTASRHELSHPTIGAIWTANRAFALHVEGTFGRWDPNFIARRIIYDACVWHRNRTLESLIASA